MSKGKHWNLWQPRQGSSRSSPFAGRGVRAFWAEPEGTGAALFGVFRVLGAPFAERFGVEGALRTTETET
jgi:hypothetical protein